MSYSYSSGVDPELYVLKLSHWWETMFRRKRVSRQKDEFRKPLRGILVTGSVRNLRDN